MVKVNRIDNQFIVSFFNTKRFNSLIAYQVKPKISALISSPNSEVIFNFNGINFIDTVGFSILMELNEEANSQGSILSISNINEDVRELISLMKLEQTLKVLDQ